MSLLPTYTCLLVNEREIKPAFDRSPWSKLPQVELHPVHLPLPSQADSGEIQRARFAACNSETSLFFAFRCLDSDIWGTYTRRDEPLYEEEVVEAFLCPTGDLRHYYEFEVSPRNVVFDAMVYSPDLHRRTMQVDTSWDCPGLRTTVHVEGLLHTKPPDERPITITSTITNSERDSWWSVVMEIPFAAFPEVNPPGPGDVWRANFYRIDRADPPEFTAWSPTLENPPNFHVPERFGFLEFGGFDG